MYEPGSILNLILKSIFVGFGIVIPILALVKTSSLRAIEVKQLFILTAVQTVRVAGIPYIILFLVQTYFLYNTRPLSIWPDAAEAMLFGPYWLTWFSPLMYFLLSQLLWVKKLYIKRYALVTMSLFLLILPSRRFLMFIQVWYRDYLPSSWAMYTINPFIEVLLNIIVFTFVIFTIMLANGKFKKIKR